jgi:hypothetical protein
MTEITSKEFTSNYRFIRSHAIPLYPTLSLYRHLPSESKVFVVSLEFSSEDYLEDHINYILNHPLFPGKNNINKIALETTLTLQNFI